MLTCSRNLSQKFFKNATKQKFESKGGEMFFLIIYFLKIWLIYLWKKSLLKFFAEFLEIFCFPSVNLTNFAGFILFFRFLILEL
jgi:hypothetical protein